jgi:hypothetical protein
VEQVIRKHRTGLREHRIYTKAEADAIPLLYVPWRDVRPEQWCETDDGYVVQCLRRKPFKGGDEIVTLSIATGLVKRTKRLEWEPRRGKRAFGLGTRTWIEEECGTQRVKRVARLMAKMLMQKDVDFDLLGMAYRQDQKIPAATVKVLLRNEEVQAMVTEELEKLLEEEGITRRVVVRDAVKAKELAEKMGDSGNMFKVVRWFGQLLDVDRVKPAAGRYDHGALETYAEVLDEVEQGKPKQVTEGSSDALPEEVRVSDGGVTQVQAVSERPVSDVLSEAQPGTDA